MLTWMSITPLLLLRRALWLEHLGIRDAAISANRNMTAKRTVAPSVLSSTVFHGLKVFPDAGIDCFSVEESNESTSGVRDVPNHDFPPGVLEWLQSRCWPQ